MTRDTNTSILKDVGLIKNNIISYLLDSDDFCQLILNKKTVSEEDKENLVYTQIFPYLYVNETQLESLVYCCIEVVPYLRDTIKSMQITILLFTDKDKMKYSKRDYLGTRIDIGADMIERILCNTYEFGIGKLELSNVRYTFPCPGYYGREITFYVPDFKVKTTSKVVV